MSKLEKHMINFQNKTMPRSLLYYHQLFDYSDKKKFNLDLNLMIQLFDINITDPKVVRLEQEKFRKELIEHYKGCVISGSKCNEQLEACHIVPFSEGSPMCIENGLLLTRNLHSTFDKYKWSIHPLTLKVEVISDDENEVGDIVEYKDKSVNVILSSFLGEHYANFRNLIKD